MKRMYYLFLLISFIVIVTLFSRTGSLKFSVEWGLTISVSVTVLVYFHNLFWKTYEECLDRDSDILYTETDEKKDNEPY